MKRFLKWLIFFGVIVAVIGIAFSLYANFLLDYSLQNLEKALTITTAQSTGSSPVAQKVYRSLINDLALEEAERKNASFENIALLDAASQSLAEIETRAGAKRSKFYLQKVLKIRQEDRGAVLKISDLLYSQISNLSGYFKEKISSRNKAVSSKVEYASIFLLSQAEEKEKEGDLAGAQALYEKFVTLYPQHPDRGFVMIELAQLMIKGGKLDAANILLADVQKGYPGGSEDQIATAWRARIGTLGSRQAVIRDLQKILESDSLEGRDREDALLRLGITQLSTYQFADAEKNLKDASNAKTPEVRSKAKFYLGWLYKMNARYEDGAKVLEELLDSPELDKELALALQAQLADLYYRKQDIPKAIEQYQKIADQSQNAPDSIDVAKDAWLALAELERASIYFFNTGNSERGEDLLEDLGGALNLADFSELREGLKDINRLSLRDRAFEALQAGRVQVAFNLLREYEKILPDDAWTMSGLATIYLLFGDFNQASEYALKGYQDGSDEYTTSVLGYVNSFIKNDEKTVTMYRAALERNSDYAPARFNLACIYLGSNRYQEALDLLAELEKKLTRKESFLKTKVLNNMGYALWWMGRVPEAQSKFQEALRLTPQFTIAEHNLNQISSGETPEMVNFKDS